MNQGIKINPLSRGALQEFCIRSYCLNTHIISRTKNNFINVTNFSGCF